MAYEDDIRTLWKAHDALRRTVVGNGQTGLNTRVSLMEQSVERLKQIEEKRSRREWAVIVMLLMLLGNTAWEIIKAGGI